MLIHHPKQFTPHRVSQNVSTLDILPTLVDLASTKLVPSFPMDGHSLLPHLQNRSGGHDTVFAEYAGEGTVAPMMMIRRGPWKYITCPADPDQLYNLKTDPKELVNLAQLGKQQIQQSTGGLEISVTLDSFRKEAAARWDFKKLTADILLSQRQRRFAWSALKKGKFTSWDFDPVDDGREK